MSGRTVITIVCLALVLGLLTYWRSQAKQAARQRELATLVNDLQPFAREVAQVSARIEAQARFDEVMEAMSEAQKALSRVKRPSTDNPRATRLYQWARDVSETVGRASDQTVRMLARARGDEESDRALVEGIQTLVIEYQAAADAFLFDYAAAQQQVAAEKK